MFPIIFLKAYISVIFFKYGEIVLKNGEIVGTHTGLYNYTIGQRRGLVLNGTRLTFLRSACSFSIIC